MLERAATFYERVLWDGEQAAFAREYLASRGLGVDVCKQFRLGYAPGGPTLARRAAGEGYTQDELRAVGLTNSRGNDYFNRRIVFPLADARGHVRGFQARKLYDDDPLAGKYVNSQENELFKKGDLLYGLDLGRQAIAKQDRAVIVEGNTDVIALRQAGFEPVVAAMGTALTEAQLKELNRLTKRLFLCFDADAAGQDATLRGMELAVARGFDVKIVTLPKGTDPADDPVAFEQELRAPVSYPVHRVRLLHAKARDRNAAFAAIESFLQSQPDSPEHLDARRLATDLLDLPPETQAALAPRTRSSAAGVDLAAPARRRPAARAQRPRRRRRAQRAHALPRGARPRALRRRSAPARACASARAGAGRRRSSRRCSPSCTHSAEADDITEETAKQLLLRLRERRLAGGAAEPAAGRRLQQSLSKRRAAIREEIESLATMAAADPR